MSIERPSFSPEPSGGRPEEEKPSEQNLPTAEQRKEEPKIQVEKREARAKSWEEMSEEERREKYGKSFEIRERLHQFYKARANLVVLEREANLKPKDKDIREKYEMALRRYEEMRAEYIGAKAWRMLKERRRITEEEVEKVKQELLEVKKSI